MKNLDETCICCGRTLPYHSFARGAQICNPCSLLTPDEIARTTRLTAERMTNYRTQTAKGRKDARRMVKLDQYAVTGKRCSAGHHYLPVDAFGKCETRTDGLQPNCKACNQIRLSLIQNGHATSSWHAVRDAIRAASKGPLNEQ